MVSDFDAIVTIMPRSSEPSPDPALARFLRDELGVDDTATPGGAGEWTFTGPVWIWRGSGNGPPPKAAWYFITIDGDVATAIRAATRGSTGGFGSVRIAATIGITSWQTSLFPSKNLDGYLLPLKAGVRRSEGLEKDGIATVRLALAG
jgi:Domain of unknown function (DUF1905)